MDQHAKGGARSGGVAEALASVAALHRSEPEALAAERLLESERKRGLVKSKHGSEKK